MSELVFNKNHALDAINKVKVHGLDWLYLNYPKPNGQTRKSTTGFLLYDGASYPLKPLGRLANEIAGTPMSDNPITNKFRKYFEELGFKLLDNPEIEAETTANRQRALAKIWLRPNQAKFRKAVFDLYGARCIISGCETLEVLEAAHILPVSEDGGDQGWNGIPLRADLHRLFDAGLLKLKPKTLKLKVSDSATEYRKFNNLKLMAIFQKAETVSKLQNALESRKNMNF